jgi:glycosyltransferase involved in cell wall biosynthesis
MTKVSKEPLISVVVPVYKVEEYLDKCVESIINQTYKNLEIILVDDGSPDNSPKKCDEWSKKDNRIKVINKKNGGVSSARNTGIDKSKGEWITFVDADDWIETTYVEDMYNISQDFDANYICCGYNKIYSENVESINSNGELIELNSRDYLTALLNVQNGYGFVHMKLINKDIIGKVRFDEELPVGEDALFNIQLCDNLDKVVIYNKALYNYRINTNSVVRKYDVNYVDKYTNSMQKMKTYINKKYNDKTIRLNVFNYIVYHLMLICVNYCYHPENKNKYQSLKEVCNIDIYKEATKNSNYDNLSLTRKITLFTIKHKMFFLTALICKIRQAQIRK